jgi:hypothetical protein
MYILTKNRHVKPLKTPTNIPPPLEARNLIFNQIYMRIPKIRDFLLGSGFIFIAFLGRLGILKI